MNELEALKTRLQSLKRRRLTHAWIVALAFTLVVCVGTLLIAFILDVWLHLGKAERVVVWICFAGMMAWAGWRYLKPAFRRDESIVKLALLVEQQHGISSELVAALQFEDSERRQYGKPALRNAVVSESAAMTNELDYHAGFGNPLLKRAIILAAVAMSVASCLAVATPEHLRVFADRFLLGDAAYPTKTSIELISPSDRVAYGQPVAFRIQVGGEIPTRALVQITELKSGEMAELELTPDAQDRFVLTGTLRRALEDCSYVISAGDARLGPRQLTVTPLPRVNVAMEIDTPDYAANSNAEREASQPSRLILAGSRITPVVTADKTLRSAFIRINDVEYPMAQREGAFVLDAEEGSPLASIGRNLAYEIDVVDVDGLGLEEPLRGELRVRPDVPPRVVVRTATKRALPGASPTVRITALDDFGVAKVVIQRDVIRGESTSSSETAPHKDVIDIAEHPRRWDQAVQIDLASLKLNVGDRVVCTIQAIDYRGKTVGQQRQSQPFVFEIIDRETLLQTFNEADDKLDKDLENLIKVEGGLGGQP